MFTSDHFERREETAADAGEGKHVSVSSHDPPASAVYNSKSPASSVFQNCQIILPLEVLGLSGPLCLVLCVLWL